MLRTALAFRPFTTAAMIAAAVPALSAIVAAASHAQASSYSAKVGQLTFGQQGTGPVAVRVKPAKP